MALSTKEAIMPDVFELDRSIIWRQLLASNSTDTSTAQSVDQTARPSGTGIIDTIDLSNQNKAFTVSTSKRILIKPFGTDADNETFKFALFGWAPVVNPHGVTTHLGWSATPLYHATATLDATLTTITGTATEYYADTIASTANFGNANVSFQVFSPATDTDGAFVMVDLMGHAIFEIKFDTNSSSASCNCNYAFL